MMTKETADILAFAHLIAGPAEHPLQAALSRHWLEADGAPTRDGRDLLRALREQAATRSALRNIA